jgi:hypothetical protein
MQNKKVFLALAVLLLVAIPLSLSAGTMLALFPNNGTVYNGGPVTTIKLNAFCNSTPCNLTWMVVLSSDGVGSIDNTTGPNTTFTAGTLPGTAIVIVHDDQGHMAFSTINVL